MARRQVNGGEWVEFEVDYRMSEKPATRWKGAFCENCGRVTEVLFDGFKLPLAFETVRFTLGEAAARRQLAVSVPFLTETARVCMRCRPPSSLEVREILEGNHVE